MRASGRGRRQSPGRPRDEVAGYPLPWYLRGQLRSSAGARCPCYLLALLGVPCSQQPTRTTAVQRGRMLSLLSVGSLRSPVCLGTCRFKCGRLRTMVVPVTCWCNKRANRPRYLRGKLLSSVSACCLCYLLALLEVQFSQQPTVTTAVEHERTLSLLSVGAIRGPTGRIICVANCCRA